jgi:hypothetical protein
MEAISNGVDDYLIEGLSFKLPGGSSYITDRRKCTYWASGSNIYKPLTGTKVVKFMINGEDGNWLDPSTIRIQFTLLNNSAAGKFVRPLGGPHLFFRRVRLMVQNQLAEDILDYNRFHQQMESLMPDNVRDNIDAEGFGYRWDDLQNRWAADYTTTTIPGIASGASQTVCFKLMSGITSQSKLIPIKFASLQIELEVVNNSDEAIITPGVINPDGTNVFTSTNTGTDWEINNVCVKCDVCTLDNALNNSYVEHLLAGKALPIKYTTYINQQSAITGNTVAVQVARAVSRLQSAFITLYKTPITPTILDKTAIKFYHPMAGTFNTAYDLEFQIQLGNKLLPEYPCKNISECFYHLKQTLNLPDWGLHSIGVDYKQYINNKFIFAMSFEKVPQSSWTGISTKSGQILIIKINANDKSTITGDIASLMYITLVSEQILEIRDTGCSVYD